jgi:hypothetical protein
LRIAGAACSDEDRCSSACPEAIVAAWGYSGIKSWFYGYGDDHAGPRPLFV